MAANKTKQSNAHLRVRMTLCNGAACHPLDLCMRLKISIIKRFGKDGPKCQLHELTWSLDQSPRAPCPVQALLEKLTCPVQDGDLFCGELVFAPHSNKQGAASPVETRGSPVTHHLNTPGRAGWPLSTEEGAPRLALLPGESILLRSHRTDS